jgi:hypothetical protein
MKDPILKENKVVIGPCRLSYTHLFEKYVPEGGDAAQGKFMTNVLIPKDEKKTIAAINKAIESAKQTAIVSRWSGKEPKKLDLPLRDGDEKDDDSGVYADCFYLNAKCSTKPGIVDKHKEPITDEEEVYSGMWAYVSLTFYGYYVSGNAGIACGLNNVMKFKDDERLGGRTSAANDFADIEFDDEDDDDL